MFVVGARHLRIVGAAKVAKVRAPLPLSGGGGGVGGEGDGGSGTTRMALCHVPPLPNPLPPGEREPNRTFVAFAAPTSGVHRGARSNASRQAPSRSANASCNQYWL